MKVVNVTIKQFCQVDLEESQEVIYRLGPLDEPTTRWFRATVNGMVMIKAEETSALNEAFSKHRQDSLIFEQTPLEPERAAERLPATDFIFAVNDIGPSIYPKIFHHEGGFLKGKDEVVIQFHSYGKAENHIATLGPGIYKVEKLFLNFKRPKKEKV